MTRTGRCERHKRPYPWKLTKEQKKAQRGANKVRKFGKVKDELDLCWKVANGSVCEFGEWYAKASFYIL